MPSPVANPNQRQSRWALMWLAYTGLLFIRPLLEPGLYLWLGTLASLAVFFSIFWGLFYVTAEGKPARFWMVGATFALGLATFPWNQGASTFFIYAAAFFPFLIESVRRVVSLILLECLVILAQGAFFSLVVRKGAFYIGWPNTFFAIFLVVVIGGGNIYFAEQKRADSKLRAALEENVTLAAVAERERIARDLHDVLGHTLSVIVLKAELAGRLITRDPDRATTEMADVERTARAALAEIREAIGGYRSRGLAAEIEAARSTLDAAGVTLLADSGPERETLTPQEETALALALREAVTNIVRHARATTCRLHFVSQAGQRRLVVEDDGQHAIVREGNGLRGMRERIESLGGHFSLEQGTAQNHGTRLIIELPHREAAAL
jgi:two-component system, NarL family, sensor histidine kinase DesK